MSSPIIPVRVPHGLGEFAARLRYCACYVAAPGTLSPSKIGIATDLSKRLSGIQTAHWQDIYLYWVMWFPGQPVAARVEKRAMEALAAAGKKIRGEWFDVAPEVAIEYLRQAARDLKLEWFTEKERLRRISHYRDKVWSKEMM